MRNILPVGLLVLTVLACLWTRQTFSRSKVYYSTRPVPVRGGASTLEPPADRRLRFVSQDGTIWQMTDGAHVFEVDPAFLTENKELAEALVHANRRQSQAKLADQSGGAHTERDPSRAKILCTP